MASARPFLLIGNERIVGFLSVTMGSVLRTDVPAKLVRGLPAYPVGMVLLARLAINAREQGKGLGALLLADALRKAVVAGEAAAAPSSASTQWTRKPLTSTHATASCQRRRSRCGCIGG